MKKYHVAVIEVGAGKCCGAELSVVIFLGTGYLFPNQATKNPNSGPLAKNFSSLPTRSDSHFLLCWGPAFISIVGL